MIKRGLNDTYMSTVHSGYSQHSSFIRFLGYGVALPKGSSWRDPISLAILDQQEKGTIQLLYDKWWKNTGEICSRDEKSKESKANALGVYTNFLLLQMEVSFVLHCANLGSDFSSFCFPLLPKLKKILMI